ncbi:hypothetical protein R3P38DRAFT_1049959 [Favolaschia claudopus]|uniref:Uncharacterized protein n=1 Tax=Favolaschia claudopus TaxID=2862362 RepID=A0AAW0BEN0_9AGAR
MQQQAGWVPQTQTQQPSLWSQLAAQFTGASTSSSASPRRRRGSRRIIGLQPIPADNNSILHTLLLPTNNNNKHNSNTLLHPKPLLPRRRQSSHISEFARDFYATTNVPSGAFSDVSRMRGTGTVPGDAGASARYPSPPPPRHPTQSQQGGPGEGGGGGGNGGAEGGIITPDDRRPTTNPTAGHPLLLNGNMLVHPKHHECHKCNNTGSKNADSLRPCYRCSDRYARPYAGAVTYAPSSRGSSMTTTTASANHSFATTFHKPLSHLNG